MATSVTRLENNVVPEVKKSKRFKKYRKNADREKTSSTIPVAKAVSDGMTLKACSACQREFKSDKGLLDHVTAIIKRNGRDDHYELFLSLTSNKEPVGIQSSMIS